MKKPVFLSHFTRKRTIRFLDEKHLFQHGPLTYKVIASVIGLIIALVSITAIVRLNNALLVEIPSNGGTLHEGIIGIPRYINPVLANSPADKDLTTLVYAGLMKKTPMGELEPELAKSYTLSEDGTVYTFTLKEDLYFHDNVPLTTHDIAFTIQQIQDPALNSPEHGNWSGVKVTVLSSSQIQFALEEPYAPFLYNTTVGVMPKHLWENTSAEQFAFNTLNIEPIGSGPYQIKEIKKEDGIPEIFHLIPSETYPLGRPFIDDIFIHLYPEESKLLKALTKGTIDSAPGITPAGLESIDTDDFEIVSKPLPRVFHLYLNQNKAEIFTDSDLRHALNVALDRDALVAEVFKGHATTLSGPLPPNPFVQNPKIETNKTPEELLDMADWELSATSSMRMNGEEPLTFRLTTSNHPELKQSAEIIADTLRSYGIGVDLEFYELQDLKQNIIRPREFQMLLFGSLVDSGLDLYPLWHSSQRNDPGLNISQYANIDVDADLERARATETPEEHITEAVAEIQSDLPALPLYSPHFIYVRPQHVHKNNITYIEAPHDRFIDVHSWYIETRNVWFSFINK